tara:strand:+ start:51 stop:413 length:363 start_codon:yes stop_codon:yes gene_type:complete
MTALIKKVADNIYYLKLDTIENCSLCGKALLDYIYQQKIPVGGRLILDTTVNNCHTACNEYFLTGMMYLKSIADIVKIETASHDPWAHAMLIHKKNNNTYYADDYEDAYNWSLSQEEQNA